MDKPTSKLRPLKFFFVGAGLTLCQFLIYTFIARVFLNSNDSLWIASMVSYIIATFLGYFAHSRITWKERRPTKAGVINFFIWNFSTALIIGPLFTRFFGLFTPLYELAHNISSTINLPFDYAFVESTGIFALTTIVTMILNYFFYDRLVFGTKTKKIKFTKPVVCSIILYALPIIFFAISYFLLTTSGEDIHQGAGALANGDTLDSFGDMARAFEHSGRITDMYAWSIIDFFDYQYCFGADTIFRLVDVAIISGAFYLATFIALGRKPKLQIKDALVFCAIFAAVIFSPFGRRLYSEFSMIHNYAPLVFITLFFVLPYLSLIKDFNLKDFNFKPKTLALIMLPLGFIFGMSTTITPIAVLATIIIYIIIKRKELSRPPLWFFIGIATTLLGFVVSFFLSPGMNSYATNPTSAETFDYIAISDIFTDFTTAVPRIFFHLFYNFGICLIPLIAYFAIAFFFARKSRRQIHFKNIKTILLVFSSFIILHILATAQIKTPPRILIPAYFAGIILIARIFTPYIKSKIFATSVVIFTTLAIILHASFLIIYHHKTSLVLEEIKSSEASELCIERQRVEAPRIPIINLSQEFILVDWGYPEYIHGKAITFCNPN